MIYKSSAVLTTIAVAGWLVVAHATIAAAEPTGPPATLTLKSTEQTSALKFAVYVSPVGLAMVRGQGYFSSDNGTTWTRQPVTPDFDGKLPYGYRRSPYPLFADPVNGKMIQVVLSLDTPGLDPNMVEPPIGNVAYYLRYRVSDDGGKTYQFDEPIVQEGMTAEHPFNSIDRGKTGLYVGDSGSQIIRTTTGRIIIPAQASKLGPDGKLWNPGGGSTYTDVVMILGTWDERNRLHWEASASIQGDPAQSTRGMIEPTVAEMPDGTLLCVMRGSNGGTKDPEHKIPGYKWYSVSNDDGCNWSTPQPWTYEDGKPFFSPSSMSQLLRHSSGRCFWIGNITPSNCEGNHPRYPLVIGEVDRNSMKLIKSTSLVIDTKRPDEPDVNLSHWWGIEDRATQDIVIAGDRYSQGYKNSTPVTYRIGVTEQVGTE